MEFVTIEISKELLQILDDNGFEYKLKEVKIKDGFFDGDEVHKRYKDTANKAYKQLKEYEWNKRNP